MKIAPVYLIAGGAVGLALIWATLKGGGVSGAAQAIGAGAVSAADGFIGGTVTAGAGLIGIPATSRTQCEIDKANGDTWAASFSCPAKDFLTYVWN